MNWKLALIVAAGGALGTLGRYGLTLATAPVSGSLPWGTIAINILGSFVIGFSAAQTRFPLSETARLFIMVGLCGGFTTFSAFSLQTFNLLRAGAYGRAGVNVVASVAACVAAVAFGYWLAASLSRTSALPGP